MDEVLAGVHEAGKLGGINESGDCKVPVTSVGINLIGREQQLLGVCGSDSLSIESA